MWEDVFTIISNLAFLLPAYEAFWRNRVTRGMVYLLIVVASSMYHVCNSFHGACFGVSPTVWRSGDFFFAQLVIPLVALYVVQFPHTGYWYLAEPILIILFAVGIALGQVYFGTTLYVQLVLCIISLSLILVYWILFAIYRCRMGRDRWLPDYNWPYFVVAIGLAGVSASLFTAEMQSHLAYWAVHSVWHVCAAFSQFFLLFIWDGGDMEYLPRYVALSAIIKGATLHHSTPHQRVTHL
jgi:hypothetical protein